MQDSTTGAAGTTGASNAPADTANCTTSRNYLDHTMPNEKAMTATAVAFSCWSVGR